MNFFERALLTTTKGVPVIRLRPNSKAAMDSGWPQLATTNVEVIKKWNEESPESNCGAVATSNGSWFWETDSLEVAQRILRDTGCNIGDIATFKVRSRVGRGHFYFKQNDASRAMGNVAQTYVLGQDWSARVQGAYVVSQNSLHPDTGLPYTAINNNPIIEAPQWLIDWLISQKIQKINTSSTGKGADLTRNSSGKIAHGGIHNWLLSQAGKLRALGLDAEQIEPALMKLAYDNCELPLDEEKIIKLAKSICNFPAGEDKSLALTQTTTPVVPVDAEPEETISFETIEYPVFPHWVMNDTSIYEGFAKPYCEHNSRIDYFMWMPAAAMMMNYLGTKVTVPYSSWKPSFFIVLIGKRGQTNKSSSMKDAIKYLEYASVLSHYSKSLKNADGKTIVWEVGSAEGLGTDMQRINCKNVVLFYDELSALVSKARIEGSSLYSALLKLYDSNNLSNSVKTKKDAFDVEPGSYCATLVTATTDKKFMELWSQLAGEDTGLNDRFTWVLEPKELPRKRLEHVVNFNEAALVTRKFIDKAVEKKVYQFFDKTPLQKTLEMYDNRAAARAEKWALYFAIDLGLPEIDEDCVERGIEMVKYEYAVKDYLEVFEAKNDEAQIQNGVLRLLRKNGGLMEKRDVERGLNSNKYGLTVWNKSFYALINSGYVVEEGRGIKGDPRLVRMLRDMRGGNDD